MNRRIVKVGGSLLANPDLAQRLSRWLEEIPPAQNLFVIGAGPLADCVRHWDATFQLPNHFTHTICIELMSTTARLFHEMVPSLPIGRALSDLAGGGDWIIDLPQRICESNELEPSWRTTSDSIAAWLASQLGATELALLKSALPASTAIRQWVDEGIVDARFARHARGLSRVSITNLLEQPFVTVEGRPWGTKAD